MSAPLHHPLAILPIHTPLPHTVEKRVRSTLGTTIHCLGIALRICHWAILISAVGSFGFSMISITILAIDFTCCVLTLLGLRKNVTQAQYQSLGIALLISCAIWTMVGQLLFAVNMVVAIPLFQPLDSKTLEFLRPISIVKVESSKAENPPTGTPLAHDYSAPAGVAPVYQPPNSPQGTLSTPPPPNYMAPVSQPYSS